MEGRKRNEFDTRHTFLKPFACILEPVASLESLWEKRGKHSGVSWSLKMEDLHNPSRCALNKMYVIRRSRL